MSETPPEVRYEVGEIACSGTGTFYSDLLPFYDCEDIALYLKITDGGKVKVSHEISPVVEPEVSEYCDLSQVVASFEESESWIPYVLSPKPAYGLRLVVEGLDGNEAEDVVLSYRFLGLKRVITES